MWNGASFWWKTAPIKTGADIQTVNITYARGQSSCALINFNKINVVASTVFCGGHAHMLPKTPQLLFELLFEPKLEFFVCLALEGLEEQLFWLQHLLKHRCRSTKWLLKLIKYAHDQCLCRLGSRNRDIACVAFVMFTLCMYTAVPL